MVCITFHLIKVFVFVVKYVIFLGSFLFSIGKKKELPPIQNGMLLKSAKTLAEEIRKRKLKSEEVVSAFIERIKEVDPYLNAIIQNRFKEALDEAKEADDLIESETFTEEQLETEKPLLGVPFTVKVVFAVKGLKQTAGSHFFKDLISAKDAVIVTHLKNAGGIVLATTNCPELSSYMETYNCVHGRTNNPYDTSRTPGGSSGGEAALIAAAGSVIGLGNDFSGSLRLPAHFCCLFSHKATKGFVSNDGSIPPAPPVNEYVFTSGPLCRYAEDLLLMMRLLSPNNKENFCVENTTDFTKLKVFYQKRIRDTWIANPDQEIIEALQNAASYFRKTYGCEVKEINIPNLNRAPFILYFLFREGMTDIFEHISLGKTSTGNPYLGLIKFFTGMSHWTVGAVTPLALETIFTEERIPFYKALKKKLIETFEHLLDENSVLLFPTFPVGAPLHYGTFPYIMSLTYMNVFNATGMPITQCPMRMNKNGLPIGIQIASKRNSDRLTINCAIELEKAFGGWIRPDKINMKRII